MTEIEQIKSDIEEIKQLSPGIGKSIPFDKSQALLKKLAEFQQKAPERLLSLITTIESQNTLIDQQQTDLSIVYEAHDDLKIRFDALDKSALETFELLQDSNVLIESQKEEMRNMIRGDEEVKRLNLLAYQDKLAEIESLKAITELAVKGLNESKIALKHTASLAHLPSCTCPPCNAIGFVEYTLFEIEKLQNE